MCQTREIPRFADMLGCMCGCCGCGCLPEPKKGAKIQKPEVQKPEKSKK